MFAVDTINPFRAGTHVGVCPLNSNATLQIYSISRYRPRGPHIYTLRPPRLNAGSAGLLTPSSLRESNSLSFLFTKQVQSHYAKGANFVRRRYSSFTLRDSSGRAPPEKISSQLLLEDSVY